MRPAPFLFLLCFWLLVPKVTATITHQAQEDLSIKVLQHLLHPQGRKTSRTYNVAGELNLITYPGGILLTQSYNEFGELSSQVWTNPLAGNALLHQLHYDYDANGRMISRMDDQGITTLKYDAEGRLIESTLPNGDKEEFVFNSAGYLQSKVSPTKRVDMTYNASGQITRVLEYIPPASFPSVANEYAWQWNADGTLKSIENQSTQTATYYLWNARKKLEGVAFSNGSTSTAYAYFPGSDLRFASVGKEGVLTYYQWEGVSLREISNDPTGMTGPPPTSSGGRLLDAPTDSRPATPKASAYLAGMPGTWDEVLTISIPKANSAQDRVMAIFQNHQQSVVATAEASQPHITQNIFDYLAYGEPLGFETNALPQSIGYTGRQHDPGTGLLYYRGRYFNQCTGSFIQEDPMRDGLNWYAYSNDPGNTVDPSGYVNFSTLTFSDVKRGIQQTGRDFVDGISNMSALEWLAAGGITIATASSAPVAATLGVVGAGLGGYSIGAGLMNENNCEGVSQIFGGAITSGLSMAGVGRLRSKNVREALRNWWGGAPNSGGGGPPAKITGYTKHGLNQAIGRNEGRGVNAKAILDAVRNPKKVIEQTNGTFKYVGKRATVILNQDGKVITTYGKSRGPKIWPSGHSAKRKSGSGSAQRKANESGSSYWPGAIR